ncbi:serine/threonine-protein kinase [Gimesia aquarii]|uniref:Serine/threonine-protein kinase PknB n=1 Tax=Gimesia aquarii TaxID=2527964 RepID=A0A517W4J8_9PLAN|nr:serine/threonine-protein kinase [Gimesia aquarii]QDU00183.1 Serine/threonine-protein kinase PknB [Gimesia aquarii]
MSSESKSERTITNQESLPEFFARPAPETDGPETIISPLDQTLSHTANQDKSDAQQNFARSSVWNRLFPPINADTDGQTETPNPSGMKLEHFIIRERIGRGGMGAVFRAIDTRLDRVVALKVLSPGQSKDPGSVKRFQNEAKSAARLDHENISRVFYIGEDQGLNFIAFEYVKGTNVREIIQSRGILPSAEAVNYALQVASALKHTNKAGVVHRDIKPSNIIITPGGRAKLVDLGLARKESDNASADLTSAGTTLGTFDYISPEQAKDPRNVDVRSDIYSLGCTLYHMLTGEPPYGEGTVLQKLLDHSGKKVPDPAAINKQLPRELSLIVQKMMASDPGDRYQTPEEVMYHLMQIANQLDLRGVNPEGLVWTSPTNTRIGFLERHVGWITTVAVLLVVVVLLELYPTFDPSSVKVAQNADQNTVPPAKQNVTGTENTTPDVKTPLAEPDKVNSNGQASTKAIASTNTPDSLNEKTSMEPVGSVTPSSLLSNSDEPNLTNSDENLDELKKLFQIPLLSSKKPINTLVDVEDSEKNKVLLKNDAETELAMSNRVAKTDSRIPLAPRSDKKMETVPEPFPQNGNSEFRKIEIPAITIIKPDGTPGQNFKTLNAACAAADDGSIIELGFTGIRKEAPIHINNKRVRIRAAKDRKPILLFEAIEKPAEGFETHMIQVANGSLELFELGIIVNVKDLDSDSWAIFSLKNAHDVRLHQVTVTCSNTTGQQVSLFEMNEPINQGLNDDSMMGKRPVKESTFVEIVNSILRCDGNAFSIRETAPTRLELTNSALMIAQSLIDLVGCNNKPEEGDHLELVLNHCTFLLGKGLSVMDSGTIPRELIPLHVSARNNIFFSQSDAPFVMMKGNTNENDFRQKLLTWRGSNNYYDRFETFWTIQSQQGTTGALSLDALDWKDIWGLSSDISSYQMKIPWIVDRQKLVDTPCSEIQAGQLQFNQPTDGSPTITAIDRTNAGADLVSLPELTEQPRTMKASEAE